MLCLGEASRRKRNSPAGWVSFFPMHSREEISLSLYALKEGWAWPFQSHKRVLVKTGVMVRRGTRVSKVASDFRQTI